MSGEILSEHGDIGPLAASMLVPEPRPELQPGAGTITISELSRRARALAQIQRRQIDVPLSRLWALDDLYKTGAKLSDRR